MEFRNFLLQRSVFSSCIRKSDFVLVKLGLHPLHAGDKSFQQGFNLLQLALGIKHGRIIHNRFDFPALLGKMDHFFEHTRRNVLAVGLIGAFAAFKVRILADHVFPIGALPLAQFSFVADNLFGTQTIIFRQRNERDVHVRGFLVEMNDGGYKGFRALFLFQKFKRMFKVFPDLFLRFVLEEAGRTANQDFDQLHAVRSHAASRFGNLPFGFLPIGTLWLNQVEVERAPARIHVWIAGVFLFGTFVMGFNPADFRPFIF